VGSFHQLLPMVTTVDVAPLNLIQADVLVITPLDKEAQKKKKTHSVRFLEKKTSPLLASVVICIWEWVMEFHSISFRSRWLRRANSCIGRRIRSFCNCNMANCGKLVKFLTFDIRPHAVGSLSTVMHI
jgi:hypothetical protein